jgi:conjugal transfer ATP-binding protein TraC
MFMGDRSQMKLVIIDEAWALLSGNIGAFIEKGYRRFRKYNGAAITITQSINDIYKDSIGKSIADNSAFMLLLGQSESAVNEAEANKRLALDEAGYRFLKPFVPRKVSTQKSLSFLKRARVFADLWLTHSAYFYSTDPKDVAAIKDRKSRGINTEEAINEILVERGLAA